MICRVGPLESDLSTFDSLASCITISHLTPEEINIDIQLFIVTHSDTTLCCFLCHAQHCSLLRVDHSAFLPLTIKEAQCRHDPVSMRHGLSPRLRALLLALMYMDFGVAQLHLPLSAATSEVPDCILVSSLLSQCLACSNTATSLLELIYPKSPTSSLFT